jgi:hypothetical protein
MKQIILFCMMISSMAGYSQSGLEQFYKQSLAKADKLSNEIKTELDRETRSTLGSSGNRQYVYVLRNSDGKELGAFATESNCQMKLRNMEIRWKSLGDNISNGFSRYARDRAEQAQIKQFKSQLSSIITNAYSRCSCSQKQNPKYIPPMSPTPSQTPASNGHTFTPPNGNQGNANGIPEKPLLDDVPPTQYDDPFAAIAASNQQPEDPNAQPISLNFDNADGFAPGSVVKPYGGQPLSELEGLDSNSKMNTNSKPSFVDLKGKPITAELSEYLENLDEKIKTGGELYILKEEDSKGNIKIIGCFSNEKQAQEEQIKLMKASLVSDVNANTNESRVNKIDHEDHEEAMTELYEASKRMTPSQNKTNWKIEKVIGIPAKKEGTPSSPPPISDNLPPSDQGETKDAKNDKSQDGSNNENGDY